MNQFNVIFADRIKGFWEYGDERDIQHIAINIPGTKDDSLLGTHLC